MKYKYIKRLNKYNDIKIHLMFRKNKITDQKTKERILEIFEGTKQEIENNFEELKKLWVINWIWSDRFWRTFIRLLSYLLKGVKYEWHDIMYFIWWTWFDKNKADYGLLKYTIIDSFSLFKKIFLMDINPIIKLGLYIFTVFGVIFTILLGIISFFTVFIVWNLAFNFIKYK